MQVAKYLKPKPSLALISFGWFINLIEMTEEEIEREVQSRVNFKFDEIITSLTNKKEWTKYTEFTSIMNAGNDRVCKVNPSVVIKDILDLITKERNLPVPRSDMFESQLNELKNSSIDRIMDSLDNSLKLRGMRGGNDIRHRLIKLSVSLVEDIISKTLKLN